AGRGARGLGLRRRPDGPPGSHGAPQEAHTSGAGGAAASPGAGGGAHACLRDRSTAGAPGPTLRGASARPRPPGHGVPRLVLTALLLEAAETDARPTVSRCCAPEPSPPLRRLSGGLAGWR